DLAVEGVARFHDDGVARLDREHRLDRRVEAVVAGGIVGTARAGQADPERIGSGCALQAEEHHRCEGYEMKPVTHHRLLLVEVPQLGRTRLGASPGVVKGAASLANIASWATSSASISAAPSPTAPSSTAQASC